MGYNEPKSWPVSWGLLDAPIEVPENSEEIKERIKESLEKITANPKIWFYRPLFSEHYKNISFSDLSLEKIHVFGKKISSSVDNDSHLKDTKIFFGYVVEIVSKNRESEFYVNLTQKDVDDYLLPGEIKIYKGVGKNKKFVRQRLTV